MAARFARLFLALVVCPAATWAAGGGRQSAPQRPVFHADTITVPISVTVSHRDGHLVTDLSRDDFDLRIDGTPRELTVFGDEPVPISVAIVLDVSGSIRIKPPPQFAAERDYYVRRYERMANQLVTALWAEDRAVIGLFGGQIGLSNVISSDKQRLIEALDKQIQHVFGSTPLWGTVDSAMDLLQKESNRKVVVVFTDGFDTDSPIRYTDNMKRDASTQPPLEMVLYRAVKEDVMWYVLNWEGLQFNPQIKELVSLTGGGYLLSGERDRMRDKMARVSEELHHQYQLGFEAARDGKVHHIDLRVRRPGATAHTKKVYIAPDPAGRMP